MNRSKKIVILAHCILNSNSKVVGLSKYGGTIKPVLENYINEDIGIIQLPCPELLFLGMKRWGMTKEQYDIPKYREHCREILKPIVEQMKMYSDIGYKILDIIGVDGSPSCGVNFSCKGYYGGNSMTEQEEYRVREKGIYIEELEALLSEVKLSVSMKAVDESKYY